MIIKVRKILNPEVYIFGKPAPLYACDKGDLYVSLKQDILDELGINLYSHNKTLHVVDIEHRDMTRTYSKKKHYLIHGFNLTEVCNTLRKAGTKTQIEVANFLEETTRNN
ncbi:hypothetical protein [Proteus phage RP7]|nr:hypothetical protein [Proteus phage RP7]